MPVFRAISNVFINAKNSAEACRKADEMYGHAGIDRPLHWSIDGIGEYANPFVEQDLFGCCGARWLYGFSSLGEYKKEFNRYRNQARDDRKGMMLGVLTDHQKNIIGMGKALEADGWTMALRVRNPNSGNFINLYVLDLTE